MSSISDQVLAFMNAIVRYYGKYRAPGTYEAVRRWLEKQNLSREELGELYDRVVTRISGEYHNVPDIAQLVPIVNELRSSRPPRQQLPDPDTLPIEDQADRMTDLLEGLIKAKRHRSKDHETVRDSRSYHPGSAESS